MTTITVWMLVILGALGTAIFKSQPMTEEESRFQRVAWGVQEGLYWITARYKGGNHIGGYVWKGDEIIRTSGSYFYKGKHLRKINDYNWYVWTMSEHTNITCAFDLHFDSLSEAQNFIHSIESREPSISKPTEDNLLPAGCSRHP